MTKIAESGARKDFLAPFLTMVALFFFQGFLTSANGQFQEPIKSALLANAEGIKNTLMTLITFSWFIPYFIFGRTGAKMVSKYGYKGTLLRALGIMTFGLLVFAVSSIIPLTESWLVTSVMIPVGYFVFLLGSFIVGSGVTILQVVTNPYVISCEVRGTQDIQRLNIAGTASSIGNTLAPYLVTGVVFAGVALNQVNIADVFWPFVVVALLFMVMIFLLSKAALPEMANTHVAAGEKLERSVWSFKHLSLGVLAIFFYVGEEVAIGNNVKSYAISLGMGEASSTLMPTLYWGALLVGRLISSFLNKVPSRTQLTVTTVSAVVLVLFAAFLNSPWLLVAVGLCHSVMWSAIFTLALKGLGKYKSVATGALMMGVLGGALVPLLQGVLADLLHDDWQWTWLFVAVGEMYMLYYSLSGSRVRPQDVVE